MNFASSFSSGPLQRITRLSVAAMIVAASFFHALHADVVLEWNAALTEIAESTQAPGLSTYEESRAYALTHIAMWDAFIAVQKTDARASLGATDIESAMAQAAHDVLVAVLPDERQKLDEQLAAQIAARPAGPAQMRGIDAGRAQAGRLIHERLYDLGPVNAVEDARRKPAQPFLLKIENRFRAPSPEAPSIAALELHFNQARELRPLFDSDRSDERAAAIQFWSGRSTRLWNRAARDLSARHHLDAHDNARLFAALNAALADACILAADSRAYFGSVRKSVRVIPSNQLNSQVDLVNADGLVMNSGPILMPPTNAVVLLPPLKNYPSVPATMGGAAARVLEDFFGSDSQSFSITKTSSNDSATGQRTRNFERVSAAAKECSIVGFLRGEDIREACLAGYVQGGAIGKAVFNNSRFK